MGLIPGYYPQRINVAHAVGGPALVARTIEANFGIKIDNYARVDFDGFEQVVDAVGGVMIDVERPVKDDEYPTEDYGIDAPVHPARPDADGRQDGADVRPISPQRVGLRAVEAPAAGADGAARARPPDGHGAESVSLLGIAQKAVSTDLGAREMVSLGRLGLEIDRDRIKTLVVDETYADPFLGPQRRELADAESADIQRAILRAFSEAAGQTARVEVLNGTTGPASPASLADQLARAGYEVIRVDDADRNDYADTTIEVLTDSQQAAACSPRG